MKYLIAFSALSWISCNTNATKIKRTENNITPYDSAVRVGANIDKVRIEYACDIGDYLTKKYGYDIYVISATQCYKSADNIQPVLNLYCDWFSYRNTDMVFNEIKKQAKSLGIKGVVFWPQRQKHFVSMSSVAAYQIE